MKKTENYREYGFFVDGKFTDVDTVKVKGNGNMESQSEEILMQHFGELGNDRPVWTEDKFPVSWKGAYRGHTIEFALGEYNEKDDSFKRA